MSKLKPPKNLPCPPMDFDILDLFCGGDIAVNQNIVIRQPEIGEIRKFGEKKYFETIRSLCLIPSDIKAELDQMGYSYMDISDFELFYLITRDLHKDASRLILGDMDLANMELDIRPETNDMIMVDRENGVVIDRILYTKLVTILRRIHGLPYSPEYATNKYTLRALIQEAKTKLERAKANPKPYHSYLGTMVISLCCTEEFKYNSKTVQNIGSCELVMSYQQIMKKKNALALLQGSYSGMIDVSKIPKSKFVWVHDGAYAHEEQNPETDNRPSGQSGG